MSILDERPKHPPKHCPNCGSENITYVELMTNFRGSLDWDTYCEDCKWSGHIRSDADLDYYRIEAQEDWRKWNE